MHMANRIRELRKSRNITLEELAEQSGISTGFLSRIESGKRGLSLENVIRIARALDVEPIDVTDEIDHETLEHASSIPVSEPLKDSAAADSIPEIDLVAGLGAGGYVALENTTHNGITFAKESVRDHWRLPSWMLNRMNVQPRHVAAFPAQGDSMAPTIDDGDVVFIDTRHRVPSPPGIFALADEFGGVIVKRLEVVSRPGDEAITVSVSSDNPRHMTRELYLSEVHIIGRYIGRFTI